MDYTTLASDTTLNATVTTLKERGHLPEVVKTSADALARVKELIPAGASVMNGSSRTLEEIGLVDYLKSGTHGWKNDHEAILAETDPIKKAALRKKAILSDFYIGSVHAIAQTGEVIVASNSGSQLPHLAYTSPNLILVVSTQKITADLASAMARLKEHVLPLEDRRLKDAGRGGTHISKTLIIDREPAFMGRKSHIIFVKEKLGF